MQNEYRIIKTKYKFEHHAVKSNTRHCFQFSRQHGICFEKNLSPKLLLSIQRNNQPVVMIMKMAAIFMAELYNYNNKDGCYIHGRAV